VNQVPIGIEGAEQAGLVEPHSGLHAFQSILRDEKYSFPCAVMAPELHGTPWGIIETGLIREAQRHWIRGLSKSQRRVLFHVSASNRRVEMQDGSIHALIGTEADSVFVAGVRDHQNTLPSFFRRSPSSEENSLDRAYCRARMRRFGVVWHPSIHGRMSDAREYDFTRTPSLHRVAPEEDAPRHVE
jgi:hypothetical protein